jgi:hypothetical protein
MNKIDLIVDALEQADRMRRKQGYTEEYLQEALAAARELKALKPVAVRNKFASTYMEFSSIELWKSDIPTSVTLLYALDEVKHD